MYLFTGLISQYFSWSSQISTVTIVRYIPPIFLKEGILHCKSKVMLVTLLGDITFSCVLCCCSASFLGTVWYTGNCTGTHDHLSASVIVTMSSQLVPIQFNFNDKLFLLVSLFSNLYFQLMQGVWVESLSGFPHCKMQINSTRVYSFFTLSLHFKLQQHLKNTIILPPLLSPWKLVFF